MIDINELRRLAQAATPGPWRIGAMESGRVAIDGVNGSEVTGFIDPEDGHLILAAANPQVILELLDRLEAAEQDALEQARLNGIGAERELALMAKLEAAEKAVNEAYQRGYETGQEEIAKERDDVAQQLVQSEIGKRKISEERDTAELMSLALRAKIAEMEKQEPVAEWVDSTFDQYPYLRWREPYKAIVGAKLYTKLYALPGAKGE